MNVATKTNLGFKALTPSELRRQLDAPNAPLLLDVRTFPEFRSEHIPNARNLPLHQVSGSAVEERLGAQRAQPIAVICQGGARAEKAAKQLLDSGFSDLRVLEGGTQAWVDAGYEVARQKGAGLPLIRQVQLSIGVITLIGALLALAVNPLFALIPAFTGAGLTVAGSTGWCGMALLLAKMPWNQGNGVSNAA